MGAAGAMATAWALAAVMSAMAAAAAGTTGAAAATLATAAVDRCAKHQALSGRLFCAAISKYSSGGCLRYRAWTSAFLTDMCFIRRMQAYVSAPGMYSSFLSSWA